MPYLIGGTITGTIMAYYYGFLITVIVNSIIWFVISTLVNKYYWKYTGFKEEFQLISKYTSHIRKKKSENKFNNEKINTKKKRIQIIISLQVLNVITRPIIWDAH